MRVRLYARVSHATGDQDPQTQMLPLRHFAAARGWEVAKEYVDKAPAIDAKKRVAWAKLLRDVQPREVVAVWRLDRAFRSVLQAAQDVEALKNRGVSFVSTQEGFDLTTNGGQLLFDLLVAFAAFERRTIAERIRAGKVRVRLQGGPTGGWPKGMKRQGLRGKKKLLNLNLVAMHG